MLHGLDKNLVSVQAELEEYVNKEGRKAITARAAWVNPLGYVDTKRAMPASNLADLSARLRAQAIKSKNPDAGGADPDPWDAPVEQGGGGVKKTKGKKDA
jgi:hypothetical protein